jgi:hypothetical protein
MLGDDVAAGFDTGQEGTTDDGDSPLIDAINLTNEANSLNTPSYTFTPAPTPQRTFTIPLQIRSTTAAPAATGMTTGTKVAIGVSAIGVAGLAWWLFLR